MERESRRTRGRAEVADEGVTFMRTGGDLHGLGRHKSSQDSDSAQHAVRVGFESSVEGSEVVALVVLSKRGRGLEVAPADAFPDPLGLASGRSNLPLENDRGSS